MYFLKAAVKWEHAQPMEKSWKLLFPVGPHSNNGMIQYNNSLKFIGFHVFSVSWIPCSKTLIMHMVSEANIQISLPKPCKNHSQNNEIYCADCTVKYIIKTCKMNIYLQISVLIQPRTFPISPVRILGKKSECL